MYFLNNSTYYFLLLGILVAQDSFEDFKRKEAMAFEDLRNSIESDYNNFVLKEKRDFQEFKKNVEEKWMNFKYSTSTSYVSYDKDLKARSIVDFDLGKVTVEIILDDIALANVDSKFCAILLSNTIPILLLSIFFGFNLLIDNCAALSPICLGVSRSLKCLLLLYS